MKFLTALFALIVGVSVCQAANPAYQSFEPTQFSWVTGHLWIKDAARMTNPVFNTSFSLGGASYTDNGATLLRNGVPIGGGGGGGTSPFTNISGVVQYSPGQAATNEFRLTSGLVDSPNSIVTIGTVNTFTNLLGSLSVFQNSGTNRLRIRPDGGVIIGNNTDPLLENDPSVAIASTSTETTDTYPGRRIEVIAYDSPSQTNGTDVQIYGVAGPTRGYGYFQIFSFANEYNDYSSIEIGSQVSTNAASINYIDFREYGNTVTSMTPNNGPLATPGNYLLGTDYTRISGNIVTVRNNSTNVCAISYDGTVNAKGAQFIGNVITLLSTGETNYFDLNFATQTNNVTVPLAFSFTTNGVAGYSGTALREFINTSGSDQAVSWPTISAGVNGWRTNAATPLPPAFTNGVITKVLVEVVGPTDTLARQTNCHVIAVSYN